MIDTCGVYQLTYFELRNKLVKVGCLYPILEGCTCMRLHCAWRTVDKLNFEFIVET